MGDLAAAKIKMADLRLSSNLVELFYIKPAILKVQYFRYFILDFLGETEGPGYTEPWHHSLYNRFKGSGREILVCLYCLLEKSKYKFSRHAKYEESKTEQVKRERERAGIKESHGQGESERDRG